MMQNIFTQYLCFIFLFTCILGLSKAEQQTFRLGTGNKSGVYYQFGNDLIRAAENSGLDYAHFTIISTEGSVDNLEKLRTGKLDAAIVAIY